jgi:magnesium-transporting ATPase (P-type)
MLLAEGDHISADGRLVQEAELRVDQSTLSGESNPVTKLCEAVSGVNLAYTELPNLVFAGTNVTGGAGKAVVYATGMHTEFGQIAHLTQSLGEELSPLQKEIAVITKMVTVIAVGAGILFYLVALLMGTMSWTEGFIFALGMIVAFVPEGLLPTVTLALAMGVQRMAKRNALVKRLSAVETLGSTTVICTDKTGTLTENEMTVRALWVAGRQIQVSGAGYTPEGQLQYEGQPLTAAADPPLARLLSAAALCNNTRLIAPSEATPRWTILGDPTEAALLVAAVKAGLNLATVTCQAPRLRESPFDSRRKRMSTLHQSGDRQWVYVKGAPKELLALCQGIVMEKGESPLTDELRAEVMQANDEFAGNGLRVLAIACRPWSEPLSSFKAETAECDLLFLGLMAMMDPPRPEVSAAVQQCHKAGIRIIMITGDYGLTAATIAKRIGIVRSPLARIVTGVELDLMSEAELQQALGDEVIFARVSPEHKLRVVSALQAAHHIVAVTGDGVNDAPALKKADIGIAMGITGTDVAKEAAAMILTDDNFASIVNAVEEGRAVYANIKKFTTYIFTSNAPEAVPFIFFALSGGIIPLALTIMQVLAVDLGTDLVPALALGAEPPEAGAMTHAPRSRNEHVVTGSLLRRAYLWLGIPAGLLAMLAFYLQYWLNGYWGLWTNLPNHGWIYQSATAMTLAAVVMTQIGNLFAQRTEINSIRTASFFGNPMIWWGIATEVSLLLLIVYLPFFQRIFGTAAFAWQNWLILITFIPALLLIDEVRKWMLRRKPAR